MPPWLGDWVNLLLRWTHFIAGIAWIGSSFYFIWLDRAIRPSGQERPGVEGDLWMVHSGGFYQVEKRRPAPGELPGLLHWFKWEALVTWISGIALLVLIYYLSGAFLVDPTSPLGRGSAMAIGVGMLVAGWLVYDRLYRSRLAQRPTVAALLAFALLAGATLLLCRLLSGRAAYMHVGSLIGTIMVANVWLRIIPAQREMVHATRAGRAADFALGEAAKRRSVHNTYLTFPLLFIMISNHYPATYGSALNWLVLLLLIVAGAAARHALIGGGGAWAAPPAALGLVGAFLLSAPRGSEAKAGAPAAFAAVRATVQARCVPCHSAYPADATYGPAPGGVAFDTPESIARYADRIRVRAVDTETMPVGNVTGMTAAERALLGRWIAAGARLR